VLSKIAGLIRAADRRADGYSRDLQAARLRASYQRAYFAPALFNLIPVRTDLIASMAVDAYWRLYYNESWMATHSVEENAALLIHEVSHLLRDHEARKKAAAATNPRLWNTAADCEINDDLANEGLPLPGDPPQPGKYDLPTGDTAELYYKELSKPQRPSRHDHDPSTFRQAQRRPEQSRGTTSSGSSRPFDRAQGRPEALEGRAESSDDCGSGAHGDRRPWELPPDEESSGGTPGVDAVRAEMVRREVATRIMDIAGYSGDVSLGWLRWAHSVMTPKVDYMALIRRTVRIAMRESTLGRYDRTYRRPHRRQACYGEFIMPSFYQPRPRPGFLIDTSSSMQNEQLSRAMTELAALTRQLGYASEVVVACCDAAVHGVKKIFNPSQLQLYGGGGTDIGKGLEWFASGKSGAIDLLIMVTDCETEWPPEIPPFPVITIRVGDGLPPPWGDRGANKVITIEDRATEIERSIARSRKRRWPAER
jgi:predicted metal-dependent peptidase